MKSSKQNAVFRFQVQQHEAGVLLRAFLTSHIPYPHPDKITEIIAAGDLTLNGELVDPTNSSQTHIMLHTDDAIEYVYRDYEEGEVNTDWQILWENHELLAVHKPADLPVNRTTRNVYNTLIQLVRRESQWHDAHLLHRLDQETSGVLLIAKNKASAQKWQRQLHNLILRKRYLAVVYDTPEWPECTVENHLAEKLESDIRCKMHVVPTGAEGDYKSGKLSKTHFKCLASQGGFSLIACELFTGRKHQIRAHLASLGHPIVGDKIYAYQGAFYLKRCQQPLGPDDYQTLLSEHHLLHAFQLVLKLKDERGEHISLMDSILPESWPQEWRDFISNQAHDVLQ